MFTDKERAHIENYILLAAQSVVLPLTQINNEEDFQKLRANFLRDYKELDILNYGAQNHYVSKNDPIRGGWSRNYGTDGTTVGYGIELIRYRGIWLAMCFDNGSVKLTNRANGTEQWSTAVEQALSRSTFLIAAALATEIEETIP